MNTALYRCCRQAERGLSGVARWRRLSIAGIGALAFGGSAIVSLCTHIPEPRVHDEFSYLLAADTFAHGRLSNPTHPMWKHFESFHIIQQPTYASKYPPAQGLALALGQIIGGHAILGVWVSSALACAAIYWMLLAWLPPGWALLAGLLAVARLGIFSYWSQSYWGGAVAALGGALVFGALRRIVKRPRTRDSLLMGIGLALLANSRPYEGLIASLPAAVALVSWTRRPHCPPGWLAVRRVTVPIAVVLACTAGAMAVYNMKVTGSVVEMPYQVHEATYSVAPLFLWERSRPTPGYHHEVMRDYYATRAVRAYLQQRSVAGFVHSTAVKLKYLPFYLGYMLVLPPLMLPYVWRSRWMRFALLTCFALGGGLLVATFTFAHYVAPIAGLVFAILVQAMRHIRLWEWRGAPIGRVLVWVFPAVCVFQLVTGLTQQLRVDSRGWELQRRRILTQLQQDRGRHLVVVRYSSRHSPSAEWVYNEADIDRAKVVWAREMDADQNVALLRYFADRSVWLIEADAATPLLVPYSGESTREATASEA